jgi:DNA-binding HxlR family transcriptional regulator
MARYRHDATGRSTGRLADKRQRSRIGPPKEPWVFIPLEVLESEAFRSLSINARRACDRLIIENGRHSRLENGALRVSARQFHDWGVTKDCLTPAIRELEARGLIEVSPGEATGALRPPHIYRLTFYGTLEKPATDEWRNWTSQQWPNTPTSQNIIDVPKSRDGKTPASRPEKGQKHAPLSLKLGTANAEN